MMMSPTGDIEELERQRRRLVEVHHKLMEEHQRILKAVASVMHLIGEASTCKGCPATIYWVRHRNGKLAPYDADGTNHFITCPKSKLFKKVKEIPTNEG
jgi:hypothetical protein